MQLYCERILLEGVRKGEAAALDRLVKAAHVPPDGHSFLGTQAHEALDQIHAFLAVTVGKLIVDRVYRHLFPFAAVIFAVPQLGLVKSGLAQIVQQRHDRKALDVIGRRIEVLGNEHIVDVHRMIEQAALICRMKARRGGRSEKVGRLHPCKQLFRAGTLHILAKGRKEQLFILCVVHSFPPFHNRNYFCGDAC